MEEKEAEVVPSEVVVFTRDDFMRIEITDSDSSLSLMYLDINSGFCQDEDDCMWELMQKDAFIEKIKSRAFELTGKFNISKITCDLGKLEIRAVF